MITALECTATKVSGLTEKPIFYADSGYANLSDEAKFLHWRSPKACTFIISFYQSNN